MKFILIGAFTLLYSVAFSQVQIQPKPQSQTHPNNFPENINNGVYYHSYVIYPEKLKTYFHSGEIPADFPKYDKNLSMNENRAIAKVWGRSNKHLIKEQFWYLLED
jgi:hypothetical protein